MIFSAQQSSPPQSHSYLFSFWGCFSVFGQNLVLSCPFLTSWRLFCFVKKWSFWKNIQKNKINMSDWTVFYKHPRAFDRDDIRYCDWDEGSKNFKARKKLLGQFASQILDGRPTICSTSQQICVRLMLSQPRIPPPARFSCSVLLPVRGTLEFWTPGARRCSVSDAGTTRTRRAASRLLLLQREVMCWKHHLVSMF